MERLDHFVVHIDNDAAKLNNLKELVTPMGFEFNPTSGKGTKGFKVANIWVGDQYLELPWLKSEDGGGWRKDWADKYNQGLRGVFGLCIMTDRLDSLYEKIRARGISAGAPERITFKMLFGLLKKSLPFRKVYTPPIPGTNLQIFFLEMDSKEKYQFTRKYFMKPNAEQNGIIGLHEAFLTCNFSEEAWQYIRSLFPNISTDGPTVTYDMGGTKLHFVQSEDTNLKLEIKATSINPNTAGGSFQIENVVVTTNLEGAL